MSDCSDRDLSGRMRPLEGKALRLFGSISSTVGPDGSGYLPPVRMVGNWQPQKRQGCECGLWMIQSSVVEILRSAEELTLFPLNNVNVFNPNSALPAGAVRAPGRSQVKLNITAEASTTARTWQQDVGQTLEVNADCIGISYFVPDNFYEVPGLTMPARSGLVVDVYLSVSLNRLEQSVGNNEAILTTNLFVPGGTQGVVTVPAFAREVTIYQTTDGIASALWTQWYGNPAVVAGSVQAGVLPWIAGSRRTEQESLLPDVTHLRTDLDDLDRFYTLRWLIRP